MLPNQSHPLVSCHLEAILSVAVPFSVVSVLQTFGQGFASVSCYAHALGQGALCCHLYYSDYCCCCCFCCRQCPEGHGIETAHLPSCLKKHRFELKLVEIESADLMSCHPPHVHLVGHAHNPLPFFQWHSLAQWPLIQADLWQHLHRVEYASHHDHREEIECAIVPCS